MISGFAFLLLLFFLKQGGFSSKTIRDLAIDARADAEKKRGTPAYAQAHKRASDLSKAAVKVTRADEGPKPWPQVVPAGLPPFPGGWEPDEPPPQSVQNRASQLLAPLWKRGPGSKKTEKTAGRWITYQAQQMGKKRGVVAFRVRPDLLPSA